MLKGVITLALILLVGFFSSSLPIEINDLLYIPVEQSVSYTFQPAYKEITNPHTVKFALTTTATSITLKNKPGKNVVVEVFEGENRIQPVKYIELPNDRPEEEIAITKDNPLVVEIDISQKTTRLPDGKYLFKFYSSSNQLKKIPPLELKVVYQSNPQYFKSLNYHPKNSMGIILYFPTSENNYFIPLTRFVPYSSAILTTTASNLQKGADPSTGLMDTDIIPGIHKVFYNGSTVYVNIDSQAAKFKDNPRLYHALESIVYTMCEIPRMKRVQFLLDGKRVEEISPGITTSSPWTPQASPAAYLAFNTLDRYLLFPYRPDTSDVKTIREYAYILFETLKSGINQDPMVVPTIPEEVKLLNVYYLNGTIKLDFNSTFLEAYEGNRRKQEMMMDSILYTFTTIPGVKRVKIMVEGNDQHTFADNSLTNEFKRPLYINPEKN